MCKNNPLLRGLFCIFLSRRSLPHLDAIASHRRRTDRLYRSPRSRSPDKLGRYFLHAASHDNYQAQTQSHFLKLTAARTSSSIDESFPRPVLLAAKAPHLFRRNYAQERREQVHELIGLRLASHLGQSCKRLFLKRETSKTDLPPQTLSQDNHFLLPKVSSA